MSYSSDYLAHGWLMQTLMVGCASVPDEADKAVGWRAPAISSDCYRDNPSEGMCRVLTWLINMEIFLSKKYFPDTNTCD